MKKIITIITAIIIGIVIGLGFYFKPQIKNALAENREPKTENKILVDKEILKLNIIDTAETFEEVETANVDIVAAENDFGYEIAIELETKTKLNDKQKAQLTSAIGYAYEVYKIDMAEINIKFL